MLLDCWSVIISLTGRLTRRMNTLQVLCLLVSVAPTVKSEVFTQFREMIECANPDSLPILEYAHYGCYCGLGGSGTPVDELDSCCKVHDECYGNALHYSGCSNFLDSPYTLMYDFTCDKQNKVVSCTKTNRACQMFICECDRNASECFAKSQWKSENVFLSGDRCK